MKKNHLKYFILFLIFFVAKGVKASAGERDIYQIKIYTLENEQQEQRVDSYLEDAYLPALHRAGIEHVGVFKPVNKEAQEYQQIYVLIPFQSIHHFEQLEAVLQEDEKHAREGHDYINAVHDNPPYMRIESILLRAFSTMPDYGTPEHSGPLSGRIYELRSYQGATEKLYRKKVEMFNEGGETKIFRDLGFQPIFFGEVISGPDMPNLMYLTSFENRESQEAHWTSFGESPEWIELKADPQYNNTVSKIDKIYLYPTDYSAL